MSDHRRAEALFADASEPYRKAGPFAYFFARGKLRADPVYRAILERGLLRGRAHVLDLGCGQGLLAAALQAAVRVAERGEWPDGWPEAPRPESVRGIELMPRDVARARAALNPDVGVTAGDIRHASLGHPDAVVLLDVLHYLQPDAQREVLLKVRAALPPRGLLLLRVSDAAAGLRHRYAECVDRVAMRLRGHAGASPHCRRIADWLTLLRDCGFDGAPQPMSHGTPFVNVLLVAHAR